MWISFFSLFGVFAIVKETESQASGLLGVATGVELLDRIEDWQISASSVKLDEPECQEKHGRLYSPARHSWCPADTISSEWLQLDLGFMSEVSGILTQGRSGTNQFVTSYRVSFSKDAKHWQYVTDGDQDQKVFPGNTDDHSLHHNYFDNPLMTRFIRIHTVSWANYPSLRVEIVGVQDCKIELGLPPFGKITSSVNGRLGGRAGDCKASDAYLMSDSGWCADGKFEDNWIQIDVGYPSTVNAIVTKGKSDFEDIWVTKYIVAYSNDSRSWNFVTASSSKPRVFSGNFDSHSERVHFLNEPLLARFIRFYPVNWNELPGMRIGVFGCMEQGDCADGYFQVLRGSRCVENIAFSKRKYLVPSEARRQLIKQTLAHRRRRHPKKLRFRSGLIRKLLSSSSLQYLSPNVVPRQINRPCVQSTSHRRMLYVIDLGQQRYISGVLLNYYHTLERSMADNQVVYVYVDTIPSERLKNSNHLCDQHNLARTTQSDFDNSKNTSSFSSNFVSKNFLHIQCRRTLYGRYLVIDVRPNHVSIGRTKRRSRGLNEISFCDIKAYQ
ncbi:hypothetical protein ACOME3_001801 [Neoechinorhynchus agilis]